MSATPLRIDPDRYRAAKEGLGFTDAEIARRAGIDRTTLHRWRQGLVTPELTGAVSLATVLRVPIDELFVSAA